MKYRSAGARDVDAVAGLHAESWRRNYRGAYSDAFLDGDVLADRLAVWTDRLTRQREERRTIVAEQDGVVIGFAHAVLDDDVTWGALLDNLHVAHTQKRRGVGRRLMAETAAAVLEQTPSARVYLWVLEQNKSAQAFYLALGATYVGRGLARPPGDDPARLSGAPVKLRYAWADPSVLLGHCC
jgi:GNAT superfamily N-acetyltransferase